MCVARVARDRKKNKQKEARKDLALLSKAEQQSYKDEEDDDNCWFTIVAWQLLESCGQGELVGGALLKASFARLKMRVSLVLLALLDQNFEGS